MTSEQERYCFPSRLKIFAVTPYRGAARRNIGPFRNWREKTKEKDERRDFFAHALRPGAQERQRGWIGSNGYATRDPRPQTRRIQARRDACVHVNVARARAAETNNISGGGGGRGLEPDKGGGWRKTKWMENRGDRGRSGKTRRDEGCEERGERRVCERFA